MNNIQEDMYQLICLDLDGTLLNSKHQMTERTINTLRQVEALGVKIAIVTGRPAYDARYHANLISDQAYFIGANGTVAGHTSMSDLILEEAISKENLRQLRMIAKQIGVKPVVFTRDQTVIHGLGDYIMHHFMVKAFRNVHSKNLRYISKEKHFYAFIEEDNIAIQKVCFFITDHKKANLAQKLLSEHSDFELAITSKICFEITQKGMNKSHGIKKLTQYLDIKREKVIAFGDSENDREMLKYVGHGVAMGNAPQTIKAVANAITDTNDEDGVAQFLHQIYLLKEVEPIHIKVKKA